MRKCNYLWNNEDCIGPYSGLCTGSESCPVFNSGQDIMKRKNLDYSQIYEIIVTDLSNYLKENNLQCMVLGISGGIDSTVCASICHEVELRTGIRSIGLSLPLKNKHEEREAADGVLKAWYKPENAYNIPIEEIYHSFQETIFEYGESKSSYRPPVDDVEEYQVAQGKRTRLANGNIMARIRMTILYDYAGLGKGLVIDTDNLTEHYLGFFTIHGDQGDYKPIGSLWKMEVYRLAGWILNNKAETPEQKVSIQKSMELIPTDGNGVSSSDLEQIGGETYDQVDRVLRNKILGETNDLSDIPQSVQDQILLRHKSSEYKRK